VKYKKLQQVFKVQFFGLDIGQQSFCNSSIALWIILFSSSAQKLDVQV